MTCAQCTGIERFFDETTARRELRRYRRRGPPRTTRLLLAALGAGDADQRERVRGLTFLDVGGGIGALQHELLGMGASGGTHVDASAAYLTVSREEAERCGHAGRVRYVEGDFVEIADGIEPADIVTLDRVVCCYHDMPRLVDVSAGRARRIVGLVYPRARLLVGLGFRLINLMQRIRKHPFRVFVHSPAAVRARLGAHGFRPASERLTFLWRVETYTRG